MSTPVRRAGAFAVVGTIALLVPVATTGRSPALATVLATGPFIAIAALALGVIRRGTLFELFARPGDRRDGRLYGLAGYGLAIAGLALLSVQFEMPVAAFVVVVLVVAYGNLAGKVAGHYWPDEVLATGGFVLGGALAGLAGGTIAVALEGGTLDGQAVALLAFLAASGALAAALLRTVLFERDDPLVLLSVGLLLWLFADLMAGEVVVTVVVVALVTTTLVGVVAYVLELGSLPGLLTGVLLALLTIVLGGAAWFALLMTFFGLGGIASQYRYEEKLARGVAQENEGARGSGNVLANSLVALVAVLGSAASPSHTGIDPAIFLFAFAGAVAAALADTLSSEIGGLFDAPRMITNFEAVEPGTDGAVTWQGEIAGIVGAALVAAIAVVAFETVGVAGGGLVLLAGVFGMTVDSILGATIEGRWVGNEGVNLLATLAAAILAGAVAALLLDGGASAAIALG